MKEFSKTRTTKKSIIAFSVAIIVFIACVVVAVSLNAPTASGTRDNATPIEVYGIGDDDVGFVIGDEIHRTMNVSYAQNGIVHTDGKAPFTYGDTDYVIYFTSDVAQGTGTYTVDFNLEDAFNNNLEVHPENEPENCTFTVRVEKANG